MVPVGVDVMPITQESSKGEEYHDDDEDFEDVDMSAARSISRDSTDS